MTRVPRSDAQFDQYIQNSTTALLFAGPPTTWERLGITEEEKDVWVEMSDNWIIIYPQYTNSATRTKSITAQKNALKKAIINHVSPLLDKIASSSAITANDRVVFNTPKRDRELTRRGKIDDIPYVGIKPTGGGDIKIRARVIQDGNRASRHPLSDGIEVKYQLVENSAAGPGSPNDCSNSFISKKAQFILSLGPAQPGKKIYTFFRWVNLSNYANSGPWSTLLQTVVVYRCG